MSKILIEYGGFATGAKEAFLPSVSEKASLSNIEQLSQAGMTFPNYGNPIEAYSVMLDGGSIALPSDTEGKYVGWWSDQISDENGNFANEITLTLTADEYFSSNGLSFDFDTANGIYPTNAKIAWYRDDELISEQEYTITSASFFFPNQVDYYNKIEFTARSMCLPYNRLKVHSVEYGRRVTFSGANLKSLRISQKLNPISAELPIGTLNIAIVTGNDADFYFQERQPLKVLYNNDLHCQAFVKSAKRTSRNGWSVMAEDYIGIMDATPFRGGIYEDKNASDLMSEIFNSAKIPYNISEELKNETVSGYIPFTTCRAALMQVLFAIGAVATTARADYVRVFALSDETTQSVSLNKILLPQDVQEDTRVTEVSVVSHSFLPSEDLLTAYNSADSGVGSDIFVKFDQPLHSLSIVNGTITESGANYAVISASAGCVLTGKKYEHLKSVKTKKNPFILVTDTENAKSVTTATLVSQSNVDKVLERCYNYYAVNKTAKMKIVEGLVPTSVADKIETETEYSGNIVGRISEQTYSLGGNNIVKETVLKL